MNKQAIINDQMSFKDGHGVKHGLRGHVTVWQEDPITKKRTLWDEGDNIIPISGYQWILMKMFDLFLDSKHGGSYDDLTRDTTIEIPDLNKSSELSIGVNPDNYTTMPTDIAEDHFVQGFMIGNGGASEDSITAKNTDYSFIKLRNPIPFQQTSTSLDPSIASNYLGIYRVNNSSAKSYFIKKFDSTPHIVHSWWKTGQAWDYVDPVTTDDLGPDSINGTAKTNRIESYVSCSLTISASDCQAYFENAGNNQSAVINELGLVAYNTTVGTNSAMRNVYDRYIKRFLNIIFTDGERDEEELLAIVTDLKPVMDEFSAEYDDSGNHLSSFTSIVDLVYDSLSTSQTLDYDAIKDALSADSNIEVIAYYNQRGVYIYEEDKFIYYLNTIEFNDNDEAQRIKLITYYTFKSIPIQSNVNWVFDYRIYAN